MSDDEKNKDTSEEPEGTSAPDENAAAAGPVDGEDSSSADPGREAEESAVDGEAVSPSEEESQSDSSATSEGDESPEASEVDEETPEEALAEDAATEGDESEPEAVEAVVEDAEGVVEEVEVEVIEEPEAEKKGKKADVIPGADLEPIAVEDPERPLSAEEQARRDAEAEERARREAELTGESDEDQPAARAPAKLEGDARYLATGKRKSAIARVTLLPGNGEIVVNRRPLEEFFPRPLHQTMARQPLATTGYEGNVDVRVRVHGGGISGQAGAVRHGIARALTEVDPELRGELKRRGFLTRDARVKERRKAGLKKARKRPQFSKR
jgi:small subunit ribosomal protein S9